MGSSTRAMLRRPLPLDNLRRFFKISISTISLAPPDPRFVLLGPLITNKSETKEYDRDKNISFWWDLEERTLI